MAMEIKGKVVQIMSLQTGMGKKGQWVKQEFILETPGQYPKKICLSIWGADKIKQAGISVGDQITVGVDLESREYSGRWYTEARAFRVSGGSNTSSVTTDEYTAPESEFSDGSDLPF